MKFELTLWILSSAIVLSFAFQVKAQKNETERLYRIQVVDKYGYIDKTGKVVVQPVYSEAREFTEGMAFIKTNKGFGFIDATGEFLIEPLYYQAESFSGGRAIVTTPGDDAPLFNGFRAYVDKKGNIVIKLNENEYGAPFSEGLADFFKDGKSGYIDKSGKIAVAPQFDAAFAFSEGLVQVRRGILRIR